MTENRLSCFCLFTSHSFLTFFTFFFIFLKFKGYGKWICVDLSIFDLWWWSVGLIPESNVCTNNTIKNDLGLSALSVHKYMLRKQIAVMLWLSASMLCFSKVLIMTFRCCGVDVILSLNAVWIFFFILHCDKDATHQQNSDYGFSVYSGSV